MKKINFTFVLVIFILQLFSGKTYSYYDSEDKNFFIDTNSIIESQKNSLEISDFINLSQQYTSEVFEDVDINNAFSDAISGNIKKSSFINRIIKLFFKEFANTLTSILLIIIVVILHSILKCITDNLDNNSVSDIVYYVSYILIVSIIMKNFTEIINMMKSSIQNLVTFINCLFPILISLLASSGGIASATAIQPVILFSVNIVANIITNFIIPLVLVSLSLSIISNVSDKIQIRKLSEFINSSAIWILGIMLTIFVGTVSLEGSITKRS